MSDSAGCQAGSSDRYNEYGQEVSTYDSGNCGSYAQKEGRRDLPHTGRGEGGLRLSAIIELMIFWRFNTGMRCWRRCRT
ncbi:Protein of unknown function [Pyronema omphalodes CBS 100304]|uniref:Uncharacterized protein n=1 Tax=Pyronema omphalodes (strain CBS 100304) TaxID=1076935 RepID=U4L4G3_PYROM|nr:Protein of unknown function [Pyronema omphalodes CBS 100304]